MVKLIAIFIILVFPASKVKNFLLRCLGLNIDKNASIANSLIITDKLYIGSNVKVGYLNFIKVDSLHMSSESYIQNMNVIVGPMIIYLCGKAKIGNRNEIRRAKKSITWGKSILKLGYNTKITSQHSIDCCRPIIIGDNSIIAGKASQLWTHGYVHEEVGHGRVRVDGSIRIGSNVYIGSGTIINCGLKINNSITVGSHSSVSKSLVLPGMYVSQNLRYLEKNYQDVVESNTIVRGLVERVVHKK